MALLALLKNVQSLQQELKHEIGKMPLLVLCPIDATILFFRKNRLYVATMVGSMRFEWSDNGLTELKRGTEQAARKLVNINQPNNKRQSLQQWRNNNLNANSKNDKIAKDINAEIAIKIQVLLSQTDQQFHLKKK